jgi:hypothetical protein
LQAVSRFYAGQLSAVKRCYKFDKVQGSKIEYFAMQGNAAIFLSISEKINIFAPKYKYSVV